MNWFLAGWVMVLQAAFWGLGATLLLLPRRWRRFWVAFCAPVGLGLQSALVWIAAHTPLPGTDAYALASLALPVGLLVAAFRRLGARETVGLLAGARRWWVLVPIMSVSLALQIAPFTKPPARFTVLSLGSCDAADYAAGARVFKEFSARDRSGFLGQPEQTSGLSVDNFYEFWLRINHFTPSALLALESALLRCQPYELTSLLGIVLLLLNLPVVYWLGRSLFRFRPVAAATVTLIYGCSPVLLYAVYQVALGQLLAAPAVGIILWTALQADRASRRVGTARRMWSYSGLLLMGNWLLFGGYNFFVLFAYVPLIAFVGGRVLWQRRGLAAAGRLATMITVNLLVCALLFPERVISVAERFLLFGKGAFGWQIAAFRPDGWYGAFGDVYLHPASGAALFLGIGCLLALGAAAWFLVRAGRGQTVGLAAACSLPIFCGYGILTWEEAAHIRLNASYDAYKMFTVFYPVLLLSLCLWLAAGWRRMAPAWVRAGTAALAVTLVVVNVKGSWRYNAGLRLGTYTVGPGLSGLAAAERDPAVDGINIPLEQEWESLWANQFLLHKRQYFQFPIYEGRSVTPPAGGWNLCERYAALQTPGEVDPLRGDPEFTLLNRRRSDFMEIRLSNGWYRPEHFRGTRWCWGGQNGQASEVTMVNPHPATLDAQLRLALRSTSVRRVRLFNGATLLWEDQVGGPGQKDKPAQEFLHIPLRLPPGQTVLRLETPEPPDRLPGEIRAMTFALYGLQVQLVPAPTGTTGETALPPPPQP